MIYEEAATELINDLMNHCQRLEEEVKQKNSAIIKLLQGKIESRCQYNSFLAEVCMAIGVNLDNQELTEEMIFDEVMNSLRSGK